MAKSAEISAPADVSLCSLSWFIMSLVYNEFAVSELFWWLWRRESCQMGLALSITRHSAFLTQFFCSHPLRMFPALGRLRFIRNMHQSKECFLILASRSC